MRILKVQFDDLTVDKALHKAMRLARSAAKATIFYLNLDCLYKAQKDPEYRQILNQAPMVVPDGIGISLAARVSGKPLPETWAVTDFFKALIRQLARLGYKVYFIGSEDGVARKAAEKLKEEIPELKVVGADSGFIQKEDAVIERINRSGADVVVAGMGAPLQEKWIWRNRERLEAQMFLGVGALFNWVSGHQARAPEWMRKAHLEWFWRMCLEPRRLFRRYAVEGVGLLLALLRGRFRGSLTGDLDLDHA